MPGSPCAIIMNADESADAQAQLKVAQKQTLTPGLVVATPCSSSIVLSWGDDRE